MRRALFVFVPLLGTLSSSARAQTAPSAPLTSVTLDYSAPEGCPEAPSFRDQVLWRTKRVSFDGAAANTPDALGWSVKISETSGGSRGTLRVNSEKSNRLERNVNASSCEQVVSALALVAALSVDPDASLAPRAAPTPAPAPPKPPPAAAIPRPVASPRPPAPKPHGSAERSVRLSLGITLTGRSGIAPGLAWAPRPFVGLSFRARSGYTWGLALSATQARGTATVDVGQADFTWSLARLEAFPVRFTAGPLRLEPALFVEGGQLRARGLGVAPAAETHRPTLLAGALGRVSLLAFDQLLFEVEGGPITPLVRDRFYLFESTTVFRVPALTGFIGAGVGLEFL